MIWGGGAHFKPPWCPYAPDDQPFTEFPDDFYTTDHFFKCGREFIERRDPAKPFFLYLTPSAPRAPFQAWPADIAKYNGVSDAGWEEVRRQRLAKQIQLGLYPPGTELPPWTEGMPGWAEEKHKENAANSMEVMAAMVDRVDQMIGELIALLRRRGELENTVIMFFIDNGDTTGRTGPWELYNVRTDPGEMHNLIAEYPAKARELEAKYFAWEKRVGVVPHEQIKKLQAEFRAAETEQ